MFERMTDGARDVIVGAQEEARRLEYDGIGTEHLLLAILHDNDTVATRALTSLGVSVDSVRQLVGHGRGTPAGHIPFTARGKKVLELALREALQLHDAHIGPEHILLGLVREGGGRGIRALEQLGVQPVDLRSRVLQLLDQRAGGWADEDERVEVSISGETHVTTGMRATAASGDEPRCPRCNADAVANLRARTVPLADGSTTTSVTLVWCRVCGAVIGVVPAAGS